MKRVSIVRRVRLSEANQEIFLVRDPIYIEEVRVRCTYVNLGDPTAPPPDTLESDVVVNGFLRVPVTPNDALEDIPQMRWEVLPIGEVDQVRVEWQVDLSGNWALIVDAGLEIWVIGRIRDVERADPED